MTSKLFIYVVLMSIAFMFFIKCTSPDVSMVVHNGKKENIYIDNQPMEEYISSSFGQSIGDTLYYLKIVNGEHRFKFVISDSLIIDTLSIIKGEAYLSVDFETGDIAGF